MKKIIMYSKSSCGFCIKAKQLLNSIGIEYDERVLGNGYTADDARAHCMKVDENCNPTTVPQMILVDGLEETYIGGYNELAIMARKGEF